MVHFRVGFEISQVQESIFVPSFLIALPPHTLCGCFRGGASLPACLFTSWEGVACKKAKNALFAFPRPLAWRYSWRLVREFTKIFMGVLGVIFAAPTTLTFLPRALAPMTFSHLFVHVAHYFPLCLYLLGPLCSRLLCDVVRASIVFNCTR